MSLYFWVLLGTIIGPLAMSFDKKVHFYTHWKSIAVSTIAVSIFFIAWDQYFAWKQVWGFNPEYVQGVYIGLLPIEECLFFFIVPYSCVFIHEVLKAYFPKVKTDLFGKLFAFTMVFSGMLLASLHMNKWYTLTACSFSAILIIGFYFQYKVKWFGRFALTYCVALIPFLIVNGILTGFFTQDPVVLYNEMHITGTRIGTIPLEDLYYNCAMLLPIIAIHEYLLDRKQKKQLHH